MAPRASKQADRNAKKASKKVEDDEPVVTVSGAGALVEKAKELVLGSCLVQFAPQVPNLVKDLKEELSNGSPSDKPEEKKEDEQKEEDKEDENKENGKENEGETKKSVDGPTETFHNLKNRLAWHNALGLASPDSAEESLKAWIAMKELEVDFGPRAKRRGNPGMDRILANFHTNMPQYFHLLLALMMLRAFLFRSWFACLPWLVGYQFLSVFVPLDKLDMLPQVPLEKCPVKARVVATIGLNALVWFFFVLEVVYRTYFIEKIPLVGLFVYHAYAVRPADK